MIKFPELDNDILFPSVEEPAGNPEDGDAQANAANEAAEWYFCDIIDGGGEPPLFLYLNSSI